MASKAVAAIFPAVPTKVAEINSHYIYAYLDDAHNNGSITQAEFEKWGTLYNELVEKHGRGLYFIPFRKAFVKKFFPALLDTAPKGGADFGSLFGAKKK